MARAPATARELFGDFLDGPRRAAPASTRRLHLADDARVDVATCASFGPHERWDADELGKRTCVFVFDGVRGVDDDALVRAAMEERSSGVGLTVSNLGGFHGRPDAFERMGEATRALRDAVERACEACWEEVRSDAKRVFVKSKTGVGDPTKVTTSWVNVCERSNGHGLHNHVNAVFSGVYYASAGKLGEESAEDVDEPGDLLLRVTAGGFDPLTKGASGYCSYMCVKPKVGRLVIFPSWVLHGVLASAGDTPRVSYAFNTGETGVKF